MAEPAIEELRRLHTAASPTPWTTEIEVQAWEEQSGERYAQLEWGLIPDNAEGYALAGIEDGEMDQARANVAFVAAAVNAVPGLLALAREIEPYRRVVRWLHLMHDGLPDQLTEYGEGKRDAVRELMEIASEQGVAAKADAIIDHLQQCADVDAAVVVDGNADELVDRLLAEGWTWDERPAEAIAGKRLRYLRPPEPSPASELALPPEVADRIQEELDSGKRYPRPKRPHEEAAGG